MISFIMFITIFVAMVLSAVMIYIKKKNVKKEEITIDNGFMHMKIVFILTMVIGAVQFIQIL